MSAGSSRDANTVATQLFEAPAEPDWTSAELPAIFRRTFDQSVTIAAAAQRETYDGYLLPQRERLAAREAELEELIDGQVGEVYQRLRATELARRQLEADGRASQPTPAAVRLTDLLREPDEPVRYRIDQLWPTGGRVILAAPMKSGKTTLVGNLVRSLADGTPFLDHFSVEPVHELVILDDEMDRDQIRRWLRDQGIRNTASVRIVPLRGRVSTLDLLDPGRRAEWAHLIRGADVVVLDCLRPVLDALGLSEDKDAGKFLVAFDQLLQDAGVREGLIVHHTGHQGERSRGDSRLRDWPDAEWKIVRTTDDDAKPRFFAAFGRDVNVREGRLAFDAALRHLSYIEGEDRRSTVDPGLVRQVLEYVQEHPDCTTTSITTSIGVQKGEAHACVQFCRTELLRVETNGRSLLHSLAPAGEEWLATHVVGGKLMVPA